MQVFCETYGSDETGLQRVLCNVSSGSFADINYALDAAKKVQFVCEDENMGYPASFTGFIHHTTTNDILMVSKTMRQHIAGRVINCAEELAYSVDEMLDGNTYLQVLFGMPYLTADTIVHAQKMSDIIPGGKLNSITRVDVSKLDENRKYTLSRVCCGLLMGKRIALKLPNTPNYEQESMLVLQQIMELLPQRDRCLISFATACKETAIKAMDKIQLILTDTSVSEDTTDGAIWVTLDEVEEPDLTELETVYLQWCNTEWNVRKEFETSEFFTTTEDAGRAQSTIMEKDAQRLERFFHPRFYWWQKQPVRCIGTLKQLIHELEENPSLDIRVYRQAFLEKVDDLLSNEVGPIPDFMEKLQLNDEEKLAYQDRLANLIYDGLMSKPDIENPKQLVWALSPEDIKAAKVENGFREIFNKLCGPFLIKDKGKTQVVKGYGDFVRTQEERLNTIMGKSDFES